MELKHSKHIGPVNRAREKKNREIERGGRGRGGGARSQYCFVFYSRWLNVHIDCLIKIRRTIFLIAAFLKLE